jgi:hypothetical protein
MVLCWEFTEKKISVNSPTSPALERLFFAFYKIMKETSEMLDHLFKLQSK